MRSWRAVCFHINTITAILEPDADGTVHLPLPLDLRYSTVRVTATLEADDGRKTDPLSGREAAMAALKRLRARGTFREIIDPVEWQRETRRDRSLPGREG